MTVKTIYEDPTIADTVQIDFQTTDTDGDAINPYRVDQVVIYFIERDFNAGTYRQFTEPVGDVDFGVYFTDAVPVKSYGSADTPAWLSTDPNEDFISRVDYDDDGNALVGMFRILWKPDAAREGDYMVCWRWTPLLSSSKLSAYTSFYLFGDQQTTTVMPSHVTPADKYQKLLDLYTPEMYKLKISQADVTPDVLSRLNGAVGKGFMTLENLVNQMPDLLDANATHESLLPYLANLFRHKLRGNDPTMWRKQIKRAVALNKKKGTLSGLVEALANAGITLKKLTRYWQVVSKSTWTEAFTVDDSLVFNLSKTALAVNGNNFSVKVRGVDEDEYVELTLSYVSFGSTTVTWIGHTLSSGPISLVAGDTLLVTYQTAVVSDQSLEDYIASLPLMDNRDEREFTYPPKNWNVRLIADDDVMFDSIVANRHPFAYPVIFGKVRTEFAFSENIYNMESFNGSLRDSNLPCDIDRTFTDVCSACQSSSIALDVEIEDISDDRVRETTEIVKEMVPFHAQVRMVNYTGSVNEYFPPPAEDLEILVQSVIDEYLIYGQSDFNRVMPNMGDTVGQFLRNQLSTAVTMASGTATGFNSEVVLYSPALRLDYVNLIDDSLLEILTGTNAGSYEVSSPGQNVAKINQGSPDSIPFPLDTSAFTFRISNPIWTDTGASIAQEDLFVFSDDNVDFTTRPILTEANSATPWKIKILSGIYLGTYNIKDTLPDNTLILSGWTGTVSVTGLSYNLVKNDNTVVSSGSAGTMTVTRRGLVTTEELESWGVRQGDYVSYSGSQYVVMGFKDDEKTQVYISGYTAGAAAGVSVTFYRRVVDDATGYVDVRGMYILTTPDYESALDVQNGSNPPAVPVETSSFKENYLVNIGSQYYRITDWDAQQITLAGPKTTWGLTGTLVSFSLINYLVTSPAIHGDVEFPDGIDRRGTESVSYSSEVDGLPLDVRVSALNGNDGVLESVRIGEAVSCTIMRKDGGTEQREL